MNKKANKLKATFIEDSDFVTNKSFEIINKEILEIQLNYKVKLEEIFQTISTFNESKIPISIFCPEISTLECICKYLKDIKNYSYKEIGTILNRSQKTIWQTYKNANKKCHSSLKIQFSRYDIPIELFSNRNLSNLENAVYFLKTNFNLTHIKISKLLHRDPRTIWTIYNRALKKQTKN